MSIKKTLIILTCVLVTLTAQPQEPIDFALQEIGTSETNNADRVSSYWQIWGKEHVPASRPWCSAFVASMLDRAGYDVSDADGSARSWLGIGSSIKFPQRGDLVIFWRDSKESWKGHVSFYLSETETEIIVVGGNQQNAVTIQSYPKSRVLGFRRLH